MDVGRAKRNASLAAGASVIVAAVVGFGAFEFAGHASFTTQARVTSRTGQPGQPGPPSQASPTGQQNASSAKTRTTASPRVTGAPSPSQSRGQGTVLPAVAVEAFGPNGTADGDNPGRAANVLTSPAVGWQTQWYATPLFGDLKDGTGLLIDMGQVVTVTRVEVTLGTGSGANLELRGSTLAQHQPSGFQTLSTLTDVGGSSTFTLATPTQVRYILLWCTRLAPNPNGNGSYDLTVRHVTVDGQP